MAFSLVDVVPMPASITVVVGSAFRSTVVAVAAVCPVLVRVRPIRLAAVMGVASVRVVIVGTGTRLLRSRDVVT